MFTMNFPRSLLRAARPANAIKSGLQTPSRYGGGARWLTTIRTPSDSPQPGVLDASKLSIRRTTAPKPLYPKEDLVFGRNFTDHMLTVEWTAQGGWAAPQIAPYRKIALDPATCVFHYGIECFEGQKAYRAADGTVRMFRCDMNAARLNRSAARLALPPVDTEQLQALLQSLVRLEDRFIPQSVTSSILFPLYVLRHSKLTKDVSPTTRERGYSLYLRTTFIGTQPTLGIGASSSALLYCIACPVGPYYPTGFKAVSLEATSESIRAWPGGAGNTKLGANYAPCILPQLEAAGRGFHQNLWLFGPDQRLTEAGAMNVFVVLRDSEGDGGGLELVTPELDGTILEGVTRDSVLALARERLVGREGWRVSERVITMPEVAAAAEEGRLVEAFGCGTAAVVTPIRSIGWKGRMVECGLAPGVEAGETAVRVKNWIEEIQYGELEHKWSMAV